MNIEQIFTIQFELNAIQINLIWIQNLKLSSNTSNGIHIELNWILLSWIQPNYQYSIMRRHGIWSCPLVFRVNLPFHIYAVGLVKIVR
jgi:hypothetical protein